MLLPLILVLGLPGCGKRGYEGDQRYPLTGLVTVNGEPMDMGTISFIPADSGDRVSGGPVENGRFETSEGMGANAGTYRVEIVWYRKTGKQVRAETDGSMIDVREKALPPRYNRNSELTATVSPEQTTFEFHLTDP
jgi:hypothetical protein